MTPAAFGREWLAAWNSRDLERVLLLYADDAEMSSHGIKLLGIDPQGRVSGKQQLRAYWTRALARLPELHFALLDVSASPDSIVVRYANERRETVCEYLRMNDAGLIVQGSANHLLRP